MADNILARMSVIIDAQTAAFNKALQQSHGELGKFSEGIKDVAKELLAGFGLFEVGKEIIEVTSQFGKLQAVLSNALGSQSSGAKVFGEIQELAAKSSFSVEELTGSFTKLSVEGFKPSVDQLHSLGDLATATGTSFEGLTSGLIKAQQGQFRALKDLGINAKQSGDQVKFTFRGVTTTVQNTSDAIRDYVVGLGSAQGISGSMAAASETLGGKITSLKHAWEDLLAVIGNGNSGPLRGGVQALTNLINVASHARNFIELDKANLGLKKFKDLSQETLDVVLNFAKTSTGKQVADVLAPITSLKDEQFFSNYQANGEKFIDLLVKEGAKTDQATVLWNHYIEKRLEAKRANNAEDFVSLTQKIQETKDSVTAFIKSLDFKPSQLKSIDSVKEKIKLITDIRDASTGNTLTIYNKELEELNDKLKELQNQGLKGGVLEQLADQISELEKKKTNTTNILDFSTINGQLDKLQSKLKLINGLKPLDGVKSIDSDDVAKAFGFDDKSINKIVKNTKIKMLYLGKQIKQNIVDIGPLIAGGVANIADAIGEALGSGDFNNFGENLLKAVAGFMKQLGELMISLGVAKVALKFSNNPYVLIAAGAALVVASSAISSLTAKQGSVVDGAGSFSGASTSSNANSASGSLGNSGKEIPIYGELTLSGQNLKYIINRVTQLDGRTKR